MFILRYEMSMTTAAPKVKRSRALQSQALEDGISIAGVVGVL